MLDVSVLSIGSSCAPPIDGCIAIRELQWIIDLCEQRILVDFVKWAREIIAYCPDEWLDAFERSKPIVNVVSTRICGKNRALDMGRSLLLTGDFYRASFFLEKCKEEGQVEMFLFYYSRYLANTRSNLENKVEEIDRKGAEKEEWQDKSMIALLQDIYRQKKKSTFDIFMLWLMGKVEEAVGMKSEACRSMKEALTIDGRFWPAWLDLSNLVETAADIDGCLKMNSQNPSCWMNDWFACLAYSRFHLHRYAICRGEQLMSRGLAAIPMILTLIASCSNHINEHDRALEMFNNVHTIDPLRIEDMNLYSDSLFIRGERVQLASLAHSFFKTHKYTWQTCCIVGNYYGIRRENEQAIRFFQRALRLNPKLASIWVLIGHEFMELKNNSAACMAYRRAIEMDDGDYRGWYGLGQLYDILKMHTYSLYYYQQAHKCKPQDSRMLVALGEVYMKMNRYRDAEKCFSSAYKCGDVEGTAIWLLAKLYELEMQPSRSAQAYETYLKIYQDSKQKPDDNILYCLKFLARHFSSVYEFDKAVTYAQQCLEHDSICEDGRIVLREVDKKRKEGPVPATPVPPPIDMDYDSEDTVEEENDDNMRVSDGAEDESF